MLAIIASPSGFISLIAFFFIGAIGSLLFKKYDQLANIWGGFLALVGSLGGILFSLAVLGSPEQVSFVSGSLIFPLFSISFEIDKLSAFFIFIISLITLFCSVYGLGYAKHFYQKYSLGALGFFYNLFILGMLLVVTAANGLFFLLAWEVMSVVSYFLVVYERREADNVKAGFLYLVMTHVGTVFIILAFFMIYRQIGSFDFQAIREGSVLLPAFIKNAVFILALIGFGTKAGIVPLHIWLPSAHPAAPSHVSALMSGVMIKTGIFMMIRFFLDLLQPVPVWWGVTILIIGSVSALLGVLYALTEHDIKKLLAYHSIENIGIILLGLGSSLVFFSLGLPALALVGLTASLFHTFNHAIFKSLLFLSAGSVIKETHTRNMEEYGGLIKYMPRAAMFFLVGSMAISALPPFNGFFSEWLTFQSLFQGLIGLDFYLKLVFLAAAGALAFTGGLALACFVKAFGVTFLARPRSQAVKQAKDASWLLSVGMGALAVLSLLLGLFSGTVTGIINSIARDFSIFSQAAPAVLTVSGQTIAVGNFAAVAAPAFVLFFILSLTAVFLAARYFINRRQKIHLGATWDCGVDLTPRMEITATGFSRSLTVIFKGILKPSLQHEVEYHDDAIRYLPKSRTIILTINDMYRAYLYAPLNKFMTAVSERAKKIQSGNVNAYILYIFLALLVALFAVK